MEEICVCVRVCVCVCVCAGTELTCFTRRKAQILTPEELQRAK
jgi:hypothetical protein